MCIEKGLASWRRLENVKRVSTAAGVQLLRAAAVRVNVGDSVEVRWQGEWWPAVVQELRGSRCSGRSGVAGAEEVVPEAVRVQFEGGTDEEWVKLASGDMRIPRTLSDGMPEEEAPEFESHSSYWLAAGAKNSDFTRQQAELLAELLEYRYVDLICLRAHCKPFVFSVLTNLIFQDGTERKGFGIGSRCTIFHPSRPVCMFVCMSVCK